MLFLKKKKWDRYIVNKKHVSDLMGILSFMFWKKNVACSMEDKLLKLTPVYYLCLSQDYREDGMDLASDASSRSGSESNSNSNKVTPCSECKSSPSLELAALDDYDEEDEEFQQYKKRVIEDWENEYDADNQNGQDRTLRKAVNGRSLAEELQEVKSSPATASEELKQNGNLILPRKPQAKAIPKTPGTGGGGGGGGLGVGGMGLEGCYRLGGYREDSVVEEESQLPTMDWAALERHLAGLQFREQQENHNRNLGRTNSMNVSPGLCLIVQ